MRKVTRRYRKSRKISGAGLCGSKPCTVETPQQYPETYLQGTNPMITTPVKYNNKTQLDTIIKYGNEIIQFHENALKAKSAGNIESAKSEIEKRTSKINVLTSSIKFFILNNPKTPFLTPLRNLQIAVNAQPRNNEWKNKLQESINNLDFEILSHNSHNSNKVNSMLGQVWGSSNSLTNEFNKLGGRRTRRKN